ncbi:NTP transferase domain-containing protein [Candidatus Uabimicrobium sp. HlEnr_7]|uniref:NTP transferase domain-containing protein n=1 Tax=Candidatus Uabimicrobium helgolandensis TaxID=3095367 RepID=UPI0035563743
MKAILLAAGMGTRLRPLTLTTPKSLIVVNGQPLLERQIDYLRVIGVKDIFVVTGYLSQEFDYLKDQGITLIHNPFYDKYNNIYTMYLVKDLLGDSYVIDADAYLHRNFLINRPQTSLYFSGCKENVKEEWRLHFDDNNKVLDITVESGTHYIMSGISYWTRQDADIIVKELNKTIEAGSFTDLYWDDIVKNNLKKLNVYICKINNNDWFEIDSLDELHSVQNFITK